MSEKTVDAVATAPITQKASVSVPVKMDGNAALSQMMQQLAASQQPAVESPVNPAEQLRARVSRMEEIYAAFAGLQVLGKQLHGANKNGPLPESLQIDNITINFRLKAGEGTSAPMAAVVKHVGCTADIANLITTEMGVMIFELQQLNASILDLSQRAEEQYAKSRKHWEENNKDRQISFEEVAPADNNEKSSV